MAAGAGWYPCPDGSRRLQYWDGGQWTGLLYSQAAQVTATPAPLPPAALVPSAPTASQGVRQPTGPALVARTPRRRRPDRFCLSTLVLITLLAPVSIFCVHAVTRPLADMVHLPVALFIGLWLVAWLPLIARPVQARVASRIFHVREPTPAEHQVVGAAWSQVLARAGQSVDTYLLRVEESADVNAAASAGHVVSVTTGALRLPRAELEAVLAHELAHHLGLHAVAGLFLRWLMWPVEVASAILERMWRWASTAARTCHRARHGTMTFWAWALAFGIAVYAFTLRAVTTVVTAVVAAINRGAEYRADAVASELGYGPALANALSRFLTADTPPSLWARLASDHPALEDRLGRLAQPVT